MIPFLYIVLIIYTLLIFLLIFGFTKMKPIHLKDTLPKNKFSIVIPFRNEAKNLPHLLHTINALDYPKEFVEIILVDDDSDEKFSVPNSKFPIIIINNNRKSNSPKKDAIETAILIAKQEWIITTDADCLVPKNWLKVLDNYIQQTHKKMIAAGVSYLPRKGFLHAFQTLDFLSLQGATIGSFGINKPFMCNGANFAYKKTFFNELKGFENNTIIASGDDVFLLQKALQKEKSAIGFCMHPESIVKTSSVTSWKGLFLQRVRWASKSTDYYSIFGKTMAVSVFLTNFCWILIIVLGTMHQVSLKLILIYTVLKFSIDFILLLQTSFYFNTKIKWILISLFAYPFFSSTVAFYSLFGNYTWKGRTFRK